MPSSVCVCDRMMAHKWGPKHVVNSNEIEIQTLLVVFWLTKPYSLLYVVTQTLSPPTTPPTDSVVTQTLSPSATPPTGCSYSSCCVSSTWPYRSGDIAIRTAEWRTIAQSFLSQLNHAPLRSPSSHNLITHYCAVLPLTTKRRTIAQSFLSQLNHTLLHSPSSHN